MQKNINMSLESNASITGLAVIGDRLYVTQTDDPRIKVYEKHNFRPVKILPTDDKEIPVAIVAVKTSLPMDSVEKRKRGLPDILKECGASYDVNNGSGAILSCDSETQSIISQLSTGTEIVEQYVLFVCLKDNKTIKCIDPESGASIYRKILNNRPVHMSAGLLKDTVTLSVLCGYSGTYRVHLYIVSDHDLILVSEVRLSHFDSVHCSALLPDSTFRRSCILVASKGKLSVVTTTRPGVSNVCSDSAQITSNTVVEVVNSGDGDDAGDNRFHIKKSLIFPADIAVDTFGTYLYIAQCSDKDGKIITCGISEDLEFRNFGTYPTTLPHRLCFDQSGRKLYVGSAWGTISTLH